MQTLIHTPTPNLQQSLDFYQKLNFAVVSENEPTLISDGKFLIEINPDRYARAGVKLYRESWEEVVKELKKITPVVSIKRGYVLSDPNGVYIYLMEGRLEANLSEERTTALGNFAGISLETIHIPTSAKIWKLLGWEGEIKEDQGWTALTNPDNIYVSLMKPNTCPHLFFNPSLTYFNGKQNPEIIDNIRKLGILITEEITIFNNEGIVDNIIVCDPGGYGFFIFND